MSFPVDLMATKASPNGDQIEARAGAILSGGRGDPYGHMVMPDGGVFNFDDGTVWIERLSPQTCTRLFKSAQATAVFLNVGVQHFAPMVIKGSKAKPWKVFGKPVVISNPAGLCSELRKDMAWRPPPVKRDPFDNYVGEDDPHPPLEPGTEARLDHDASGVAAQCETLTRGDWDQSRFTITRWLTTQSPKWGVIWRADIAQTHSVGPRVPGILGMFASAHMRLTCWRDRTTGKLARDKRTLEALEDETVLAPLAGADVVTRK